MQVLSDLSSFQMHLNANFSGSGPDDMSESYTESCTARPHLPASGICKERGMGRGKTTEAGALSRITKSPDGSPSRDGNVWRKGSRRTFEHTGLQPDLHVNQQRSEVCSVSDGVRIKSDRRERSASILNREASCRTD